jgi:8-oxo-dGTP pyrophosphatase MutT (NUDIX family)/GNAT superfamily N-acetyltransferase
MLRKYATATIISAEIAERNALGLVKASHRAVFTYEPRPGFLYVRSRMISSRCNDNWDEFPAQEIRQGWPTFIGKPAFVNHHNEDHRRMRGVIIDAALHEDRLPSGKPDTWVEGLHEIDAIRFPKLAQAIITGRVNRTSMGTDVEYSECSACGNRATTPAEYCQHIPRMKGKVLYRHTASGKREGHLIREKCYGLRFFENSFLVEDPADPTAVVTGVDERGLKTTAMHKEAIPEGLGFHFEPSGLDSGHHRLFAHLPNGEQVGHLFWEAHPDSGVVGIVKTDPRYERQGVASALWRRAHEVANEHGLVPPRHSEAQTPKGMGWAEKVDQHPVVMPGQRSLFTPPEPYATTMESARPHPSDEDIAAHIREHHSADPSWASDPAALQNWHQRLHGYDDSHRHAMHKNAKTSMLKLIAEQVTCDRGCQHDSPYGGAGMLIRHMGDDGQARYLLQKRAPWVDHPDTWAFPGGGLHEGEEPTQGAMRETTEEMGELPAGVKPTELHTDDHGGWAFHTLMADAPHRFEPSGADGENAGHGWFTLDEMSGLPLHPGFKKNLKAITSMQTTAAAAYENPADHPFFKANPVKPEYIVTSFMQADKGQRAQGMRWYSDAHLLAGHIANGNHAKGAGVLAAYSPKAGWPDNIFNAARSLQEGRALGKGEGASIMGQHQRTAQKIMDGEHHSKVMKSPKISDFAHLIEHGDDSADEKKQGKSRVVVDRHALSVAIGRRVTQQDIDDAPLHSRHYYEHVADAYRTAARQISDKIGQPVAPHQVQAVTWGVQQRANEAADAAAAENHARGRATRTNNSWKRWEEHGKENYPALHDEPPNLHRRREGARKTYVDEVDSGRRLVNFSGSNEGGNLIREDGRWRAENDYGEPVGEPHRSHRVKLRHLADDLGFGNEDLDVEYHNEKSDKRDNFSIPKKASKLGYGETKAPQEVDTLRTQSCPVCGEQDSFDGDRCQVCNYIQPPPMFQDPDTGVARQMDMQKVPFDQGMVGPNGEPVQGPPGDPTALEPQPMDDVPGEPGDEIADLFCPSCGFSADTQEPMTDNDPSMPAQEEGLVEGDVCPNCGQATLLSANDVGEMGGEMPQEIADDANADGIPDDQEPGVEEGLEEQAEEGALPGEEGPATPDADDEEAAELEEQEAATADDDAETGEQDVDSGRESDDDEEEPNALPDAVNPKKKAAKGWKQLPETPMRETMTQPKEAAALDPRIAALQQIIDRQDKILRVQAEQLKVAGQQLHYLATVAGVSKEFDALKREGAKVIADIMNPAQPIPDPAGTAPSESTDQAATPETFDDPRKPGLTPGSVNGVPAQMTDTPLQPGVTVPTQPFTNLVDVTAPVEGTQTHVPNEQTRIETDVRVGDPMANADNPQGYAFPLTGPFAADGAASVGTTTSPGLPVGGSERTMASLRLAKLRREAGLSEGDDFIEGAKIESTAGLSLDAINVQISTLEGVRKAASKREARRPQGGAVPRQVTGERTAPSLVGASRAPVMSTTAASLDDDASDLFV